MEDDALSTKVEPGGRRYRFIEPRGRGAGSFKPRGNKMTGKSKLGIYLGICLLGCGLLTGCSADSPNASQAVSVAEEIVSEQPVQVVPLQSIEQKDEHAYSCDYNGTTREFIEYGPEDENGVKGVIFMLHGYGSGAENFRLDTKMDEVARERGYVVVYVTGSKNEQDKTSSIGWNSGIGDSSSDDLGYLKSLAGYMQDKYGLTREETFVTGFSNGGFMTYRIAVEGQDSFAAVASVAGMMPQAMWELKPDRLSVSLLQVSGSKDDVVPMNSNGSAKYAKAPAIEDVLDYFAVANGLTKADTIALSEKAELIKRFEEGSHEQVWSVLIRDGRHSWPQEDLCGFSVRELILDFFDTILSTNR